MFHNATYVPVHVYITYFVNCVWLTLRCTLSFTRLIEYQFLQWLHALLSSKNIYSTIELHIWNAADAFMKEEGMKGLHNTCFPQSGGIAAARHWSIAVTRLPTRCARGTNKRVRARTHIAMPEQREQAFCTSTTDLCAFPKERKDRRQVKILFHVNTSITVCLFVFTPNGF